ncbi:hypothetical protein CCACVL1_28389 [Corchorus capsularis]|uniref:Uncharacterized protein n=1 Tax=Corchorus capsularis TaxID=210143 RepID=A0A1R3G6N7_COCAP|nr:hypothetical protein CCACVL1_28389 [Corchorus capsularis]
MEEEGKERELACFSNSKWGRAETPKRGGDGEGLGKGTETREAEERTKRGGNDKSI